MFSFYVTDLITTRVFPVQAQMKMFEEWCSERLYSHMYFPHNNQFLHENIFSILFAKSKFNESFIALILKTFVHYLRKNGGSRFYKNKKRQAVGNTKKNPSVISFQKFLIFKVWVFSENAQCFARAFRKVSVKMLRNYFWYCGNRSSIQSK